jgi:hypothetical protein
MRMLFSLLNSRGFFWAYVWGLLLLSRLSFAGDISCPMSVSVNQTAINLPSGWETIPSSEPAHLDRVGFYLGHPSSGGTLTPDTQQKRSGEEAVTWKFVRGAGDEFWVGCLYAGTKIIIAQKLDTHLSQCVVRYALLPSGSRLRLIAISCK